MGQRIWGIGRDPPSKGDYKHEFEKTSIIHVEQEGRPRAGRRGMGIGIAEGIHRV